MFDFRMTYPNIIRTFNISTETLRLTEDKLYIKSPHAGVYFDKKPSLVSEILVDLMNKRYEYEAEMKKYEFKSKEYESFRICQDTIKEICNSIYGISGDPKSRYYHTDVAASITETGRVCLKIVAFLFKDYGYKILQGDTDSLYVIDEQTERKEDVSEILKKVNERLTKTLITNFNIDKSTIVLADKGVYSRMLLVRKKGYAGLVEGKTDILGLEAIKADTVGFAKEMQKELIENLLRNNYNLGYYVNFMNDKKKELYETQITVDRLIIRQTLTKDPAEYKSKLAHVAIAKKMIEMGQLCYAGTSIEYIIKSYKPESTPILPSEYDGIFDRDYYWENKCGPLCQRVLEVVFKDYDWNQIYTVHEKKSRKKSTKNDDKSAIL
jgi:DNA polymerase elongation subunit (family B)